MKISNEELSIFLKEQGFIFPGSEIYNGLANSWDYGPLGAEVINNIKNLWWKYFITNNDNIVGIDSSIFLNTRVWEASGHIGNFSDPLVDCKNCNSRFRADDLIENENKSLGIEKNVDNLDIEILNKIFNDLNICCPVCKEKKFTSIRYFNLMFETNNGVLNKKEDKIFLRPETAQGIFINFKNVLRSTRKKLPFGIGQIGKSFRNEITPGNIIFRTKEFEQMELEFFCHPNDDEFWYRYWIDYSWKFLLFLGINEKNIKLKEHSKEQLSHYSKATTDIQYRYNFGYGELWGIANRRDYDLRQHMKFSNKNLEYLDPITNEKILPYCIEPSVGVGRLFLALLTDSYTKDYNEKERIILKLHPLLSPYIACILPLTKKLDKKGKQIFNLLKNSFSINYESSGSIGKRYYKQDAIGTKYCVTVDYDTLEDNSITIRDRDTKSQIRIPIDKISIFLHEKIDKYYNFGN